MIADIRLAVQNGRSVAHSDVRELSRVLLARVLDEKSDYDHLIIIPDGPLILLPFEMLADTQTASKSDAVIGDRCTVTYHLSATLFARGRRVPVPPLPGRRLLAFGDPAYPDFAGLKPLPGTERELASVMALFNMQPNSPDLKLASQATKSVLSEMNRTGQLATYSHLHIAAHGLTPTDNPELQEAALALAYDPAVGESCIFLKASEVSSMKMKADLVVLSACRTALGEDVRGEGIVGLSRALLYAGARSVVVSLWSVSDKVTPDYMRLFYEYLMEPGATKADALAKARRAIRPLASIRRLRHLVAPYMCVGFHNC